MTLSIRLSASVLALYKASSDGALSAKLRFIAP